MKKLLSILLVIAIAATFLSGCTKKTDDANATPTPAADEGFKNLKPNYGTEKDEDGIWKDVITFNVFNTTDYQTRWNDGAKAFLLENYHLKVGYIIPAIPGFADTWSICQDKMMEDASNRADYRDKLRALFLAEKTRPDFLPALYASCVGTDAAWFDLADYLTDLAPYVEEGGVLYDGYVGWAWGENADYWEQMKQFLMTDDGKLYAIPRIEEMPIQFFLGFSTSALQKVGVAWEDKPTTWDGLVDLMKKYKAAVDDAGDSGQFDFAAFRTYNESGSDLLQFIATTYGLDFTADFSWTTKNGEPLWTYYWDEYLSILKNANELAAEGLVICNAEVDTAIAGYMLDKTDTVYKASIAGQEEAGAFTGIAAYVRDDRLAWWTCNGRGTNEWETSDTWISQNGYTYSLSGGSRFDSNYLAIGNGKGTEFVARILDFWNFSLSDEGYLRYCFGKEGYPFADTLEEAGNYIIDEDGKVVWTNHENRLPFEKDEDNHWWATRDADWWIKKDSHYEQYIANYNGSAYGNAKSGDGDTLAQMLGFTDTKVFDNSDTFRVGTWFFADVTSYPMEKTAYWPDESMSKSRPNIEKVVATATENNTCCYKGFYKTTSQVLGRNAVDMDKKIANLQTIAKTYTIGFLSGEQTEAGWTNYIKSLQDAGYDEVYDYYKRALVGCVTESKEGVASQSSVNAARNAQK